MDKCPPTIFANLPFLHFAFIFIFNYFALICSFLQWQLAEPLSARLQSFKSTFLALKATHCFSLEMAFLCNTRLYYCVQWTLAHKLPHAAQTGSIEFVYTGIYAFLSLFLPKMVSLEQVLEKKQFQFNHI